MAACYATRALAAPSYGPYWLRSRIPLPIGSGRPGLPVQETHVRLGSRGRRCCVCVQPRRASRGGVAGVQGRGLGWKDVGAIEGVGEGRDFLRGFFFNKKASFSSVYEK